MIEVRTATSRDAAVLGELNMAVQALHHDAAPMWFKAPDAASATGFFRQLLELPGVHGFVAETPAGVPLGYALARILEQPDTALTFARTTVDLDQIAVLPDHRRRGAGSALVDAVKALANDVEADRLHLTVWEFNEEAQCFFAATGFRAAMRRMTINLRE